MRAYMIVVLSLGLTLSAGCSDSDGGTAGSGGSAGTGGSAGAGGEGGNAGSGGEGGSTGGVTVTEEISLGCANSSPIGLQSILSAELTVTAGPITANEEFTANVSGVATFPESFLDAAQAVILGGLRQAKLTDLQYIVQVRSGATIVDGDPDVPGVPLEADASQLTPGEVRLCNFPTDQECTANSECVGGICNEPVIIVDVPSSDDCSVGGVCDMLGKTGPQSQCENNGFCVTGPLNVPLLPVDQVYMAEATGPVLFGYAEVDLDNSSYDPVTMLYTIPKPSTLNPIEQGLQVDAGLQVSVECVMGVDEGVDPDNAENTLVGLTPDMDLISFDVQ